jgi:hypothetical protein
MPAPVDCEVKPHNIYHLLLELRILAEFEGLYPVGL